MAKSEAYYDNKVNKHNEKMLSKIVNTKYPTNSKFRNLSGNTYEWLYVDHYIGEDIRKDKYYLCKCKCGRDYICKAGELVRGTSKSCGCFNRTMQSIRLTETNKITKRKHGGRKTRLYRVWIGIRQRCFNPRLDTFSDYGGRGITLCEEWRNLENGFENFRSWSYNNGYSEYYEKHRDAYISIDRKDNNDNYCPYNCRWTTEHKVQDNNRRSNRYIHLMCYVFTIAIWSDIVKLNKNTIENRLRNGWNETDAILVPLLPSYVKYKEGEMPIQVIQIPPEMEVYNKYDEFVSKGLIKPYIP